MKYLQGILSVAMILLLSSCSNHHESIAADSLVASVSKEVGALKQELSIQSSSVGEGDSEHVYVSIKFTLVTGKSPSTDSATTLGTYVIQPNSRYAGQAEVLLRRFNGEWKPQQNKIVKLEPTR